MNNNIYNRKLLSTILAAIIFIFGFALGQSNIVFAVNDLDAVFDPLYDVFHAIRARSIRTDLSPDDLIRGAIDGMIDTLDDPHSAYMDPDSYSAWMDSLSGDIEGIGVVITYDEDTGDTSIVEVISGSPAENTGLKAGDIFYSVDGTYVRGIEISEWIYLVRGPAGSNVDIVIDRGGELIRFRITRARVEIPNVEYEVLDSDIAYISMAQFDSRSKSEMDVALGDLNVNNTRGLIFDLRNNPGGLVSAAVDIVSIFVDDGVVLYEVFNTLDEEALRVTGDYTNIDVPIIVLVNENSASASELVSGALQDYEIATVMGVSTYGKGTVQTIQPLDNGGALRLTIARYLLPSRRWIHTHGIQPDIIVEQNEEDEIDNQLQAAIDYILDN